jgi:hypothetical protein
LLFALKEETQPQVKVAIEDALGKIIGKEKLKEAAKIQIAQVTINQLSMAIKMYEGDFGQYPPSGAAYSDTALVLYLDGDPSNGGPKIQYFEFPSDKIKDNKFLDPWGMPYFYRELKSLDRAEKKVTGYPEKDYLMLRSFQIYSMGPTPADKSQWITNYRKIKLPSSCECGDNLAALAQGASRYKWDYGRGTEYPKNFDELYTKNIITEKAVFTCSVMSKAKPQEFGCDYCYLFHRAIRYNDKATTILGYCVHHGNFVPTVFVDGHMENLALSDFKKRYEVQVATLAKLGVFCEYKKGIIIKTQDSKK